MFPPNRRDLRALEIANKNLGVKDELIEYHRLIDTLLYLNEGLRESKTQIKYWQSYSETLLIKLCFHAFTIHQIFSGLILKSSYYPKELNNKVIIDRSSAIVILRSQLETYLMYRHIYINPKTDDEKELRYNAWIYSSLYQRQGFPANSLSSQEQKKKDAQEMKAIKEQIQKLTSYKSLTSKQQVALLDAGSSKLFNHWSTILLESGYDAKHAFSINYGYWSSYAHSEGLSAMQMHGRPFSFDDNDQTIISDIQTSKMIICIMIIILKNVFKAAEIKYNTLPEVLQYDIEFFNNLSNITKIK